MASGHNESFIVIFHAGKAGVVLDYSMSYKVAFKDGIEMKCPKHILDGVK